jgi:hypothetical protein
VSFPKLFSQQRTASGTGKDSGRLSRHKSLLSMNRSQKENFIAEDVAKEDQRRMTKSRGMGIIESIMESRKIVGNW